MYYGIHYVFTCDKIIGVLSCLLPQSERVTQFHPVTFLMKTEACSRNMSRYENLSIHRSAIKENTNNPIHLFE